MTTATLADERVARTSTLAKLLKRPEIGAFVAAIAIFAFFAATTDVFATASGASTWLRGASTIGIMAVAAVSPDIPVGTFDVNADVVQNIIDGKLVFAIDQQPYVQGYLGVTGIYLKVLNGNDIGGGQPINSGPAFITKDNADAVLKYAANGTR